MKKTLSKLSSTLQGEVRGVLLLLALFANMSVIYASNTQVGGIWYDFNSSTKTASVTYRGSSYSSYEGEYSGSVVIPETVTYNGTTYSVTSIGKTAFDGCTSLTSVNIPNSVTSIGQSAFYGCSSLTSVTIPNSVTSIGGGAFYECSSLTSVTIPNSVTSIGDYAFSYCSSLTSVTIPNSVTSIRGRAFWNCSSLTSVTIGESVTSIEDYAFYYCSKLTSVTIPNSVTSIGDDAFSDCSSLTSVTIGESVTSIGDYAFEECSSLTSVTINSDAIVSKGYSYSSNISHIFGSQVTEYIIGESVTSIGYYAFSGCSSLTSVTIPNSVTSIGDDAFYNCSSLTSVTIGNSVTSIGDDAFYNCSKLTKTNYTGDIAGWCNIIFGDNYANPMYYSHNFYINDQEIKDLVIPNNVTTIGGYAFYGCSSLTSVTIPNSVTTIGGYAFYGCSSLTSVTINSDAIVNKTYSNSSNISDIFGSQVTEYIIGDDVKGIGKSAFASCSSLTSVTIGSGVMRIGEWGFYDCSSLTSVTIGNSVMSIGNWAFLGCSSLISVTIPNSVTSIETSAFSGCSSLTSITCEAENPPTLGSYALNGVSTSTPVYVPCRCVEAYKAANGWKDFTNIQEPLAEYSIEVDVNDSIMGTGKVDKNTACGNQISATAYDRYHFVRWSDGNTDNPRTLELTQDTILIAEFAQSLSGQCGDNLYWSYDETAKTVSITGSGKMYNYTATTQPWLLFKEQIVEVTTNNTVTSIGTSAFEGCVRLAKISLGTGLEEIAANAFAGCTRLYDIYTYATYPPFADESSFANYNVYVYIPCEYQRDYILDVVWGKFKFIECLESEDVTTDGNVTIVPSYNDVTITWPTEDNADTYTIIIKNGDEVFCTLTFNSEGQLLNIAFAPGRDGNRPAQYAEQAVNGYRFTVTGLTEATRYAYSVTTKDAANQTIATYSGEFTTKGGTTTDMDNIQSPISNCQKILRNGQFIIVREGVEYNAMGQEM